VPIGPMSRHRGWHKRRERNDVRSKEGNTTRTALYPGANQLTVTDDTAWTYSLTSTTD
jgi:hypothetical protein